MSKLLPCPFCASRAPYIEEDDRCGIFVICSDCGARSGLEFFGDIVGDHCTRNDAIDAAIDAWNKRAEVKVRIKRYRDESYFAVDEANDTVDLVEKIVEEK